MFGSVSTRRSGTIFALISLGVGELVYAATFMLPGYFGGEEGITANRTRAPQLFGLNLGSQLQVYYVIAAWALVAAMLMHAFLRTPLGRMCNAVRDNPERAEFIGYNTQHVRFFAFAVAGLFAGLAGGLHAVNYEIVAADSVSALRSGTVLLMAYIGGVTHFIGPVVGAVTLTWLQISLSGYTGAWLLYLGLFFMAIILFAPSGLAGLIVMHGAIFRTKALGSVLAAYAIALVPALVMGAGAVLLIEMSFRVSTQPELGTRMRLLGIAAGCCHTMALDRRRPGARRRVRGISGDVGPGGRRLGACRRRSRRTPGDRRRAEPTVSPGASTVANGLGGSALELRGVEKRFGATEIIRGVALDVHRGERLAIIGPNGAGKSTLFNLISGRLRPTKGSIRLNGEEIAGSPPYRVNRRGLARSFQVTNIFPRLSVFENIRCSVLWSLGYKYNFWRRAERLRDANDRTEQTLEQIRMTARRDTPAGVLTYAEQRALEIGITIAGDAGVILLDEPTAGMSRSEADHAVELIRSVTQGRTLVMVEHDMGVVFDLADRISVLVYGEIIATDVPARIRQNAAVQTAYLGIGSCLKSTISTRITAKATSCRAFPSASVKARSSVSSAATAPAGRPRSRRSWAMCRRSGASGSRGNGSTSSRRTRSLAGDLGMSRRIARSSRPSRSAKT